MNKSKSQRITGGQAAVLSLKKENTKLLNLDSETKETFKNESLKVDYKDYYFSNVIARASKTMLDCHNAKINIKKTGTDG